MRQNAFGGRTPPGPAGGGSLSAPPDPLAAIGEGVPTSNGEGREGNGKREEKGCKGGREEGEGRKGIGGPPSRIAKVQRWQP